MQILSRLALAILYFHLLATNICCATMPNTPQGGAGNASANPSTETFVQFGSTPFSGDCPPIAQWEKWAGSLFDRNVMLCLFSIGRGNYNVCQVTPITTGEDRGKFYCLFGIENRSVGHKGQSNGVAERTSGSGPKYCYCDNYDVTDVTLNNVVCRQDCCN